MSEAHLGPDSPGSDPTAADFDPGADGGPDVQDRTPFVSRSGPDEEPVEPPIRARHPWMVAIALLTVALQGISWWILDGYQVADSVEYLEHAQAFSQGKEVVDSHVIRSYGFITLLTPLFHVSDWLGMEDLKPVVWIARAMQMLFGLLLVQACARIAHRLAGRKGALLCAFAVATNPVFLQYSVSPIADIAAALFVALGVEQALHRGRWRRGLAAGLWLGAAMMAAYKTILMTGPLAVFVLVRDRRNLDSVRGLVVGLSIAVLAQVSLDKAVYGKWGLSLANYVIVNTSPVVPLTLHWLGQEELAWEAYRLAEGTANPERQTESAPGDNNAKPNRLQALDWYFQNLPSMLVWPVLLAGLVGLVLCVLSPSWNSSLLLFVFLVNFAVMSQKGSKDFRLWLPLLPLIGPLVSWGMLKVFQATRGPVWARGLAVVVVLAATLALGLHTLLDRNTRKFSGYWDGMRIVDQQADLERSPGDPKVQAASAYHWAVYLRESENVKLNKLPHHLSHWASYSNEERGECVAAILQQDWFITHLAVLSNPEHLDLLVAVNEAFEVHSLLWDHVDYEDIGPVFVLRRRRPDDRRPPLGRRFYQTQSIDDPDQYRRDHLLPPSMRFVREFPGLGKREEVWLLGWEFEQLPGDGHGWMTYHWYCVEQPIADYTIVDRLTTADEANSWQNNHAPLYGAARTNTWEPGTVYRESWPVVAATDPYDWRKPFRPMGGAYRRGDLMPATLWIDLATFGEGAKITGRMLAARFGQDQPIRSGALAEVDSTADGYAFNKDDMVRVGRLLVPVHDRARLPDDGRTIND